MGQTLSAEDLREHIEHDFGGCFYYPCFSGCNPQGSFACSAVCIIDYGQGVFICLVVSEIQTPVSAAQQSTYMPQGSGVWLLSLSIA